MKTTFLFLFAGLLEIGGGYLVWLWLREGKSVVVGIAGLVALACYGVVPVFQSQENSFGRIYAAYGAVFIILSLFWGWGVDAKRPDFLDWIGVVICVAGATVMMWPRTAAG